MKKYFTLAVVAFMFFALPNVAKAQVAKATSTTMAHLNLDSLLQISPRFKAATDSAELYMTSLQNQLYAMQVEYQRKLNEYDSLQKVWSPLIKALKEKEIRDLENNIQAFQQQAQDDFTAYRGKLYEPVFAEIDKAIEAVAVAHGYRYVIDDTKGNGLLYAAKSDDIFTEVRIKLNIPAPKPAPAPTPH